MDNYKTMRAKEIFLVKVPVGHGLSRQQRHAVAAVLVKRVYSQGDEIIPSGYSAQADSLYIVARGCCAVYFEPGSRRSSKMTLGGDKPEVDEGLLLPTVEGIDESSSNDREGVFGYGETFGEIAALGSTSRIGGVRARGELHVEVLPREGYLSLPPSVRQILRRGMEGYAQKRVKLERLRPAHILRGLSEEALWGLAEGLESWDLGNGVEYIKEGQAFDGFYFVMSGILNYLELS